MTRYLATALLAALVIVVVGYVVSTRVGASPPAPAAPDRPLPEPAAAAREDEPSIRVTTVVAVTGRVEKRAGTQWTPLRAGDQLASHDTIRTGTDARATLDAGVTVELDDRTELTVGEITASLSQLAIAEGRITANAGARGGPTVRISTRESDAIAETDVGTFDVLSTGRGDLAVAARDGQVALTASGTTVQVREGELSTARAGEAPSAPSPIPPSLFLKVAARHDAATTIVEGQATRGAVVRIDGAPPTVTADDGTFVAEVPASKERAIIVQVEDVLGRRERRVIARRAARPRLETEVEWR